MTATHRTLFSELLLQLFGLLLCLFSGSLQAPCALLAGLDSRLKLDINADLLRLKVVVCARFGFDLCEQCLN